MLRQDLVAGLAEFRTMLLQAGEHGGIAVAHHGAAMTGDIAGTGIMTLLLLRRHLRCQQEEWKKDNNSGHLRNASQRNDIAGR
jgi:hypothetical protein